MAAKNDNRLDLALPAAIIDLGQCLQAANGIVRHRAGDHESPEAMATVENRVLDIAKADASACRLMGIRGRGQDDAERRVRLRALSYVAFKALGLSGCGPCEVTEVAAASMDMKLPPGEGLLRARHVVGAMLAEDVLIGSGDGDGTLTRARLPARALEWLSGGKSSMGFLTASKLAGMLLPGERQDEEPTPAARPIPTVKNLSALIRKDVIGLDEQVRALSGRLVMHLARAKLLASGQEPGTGNQAILLAGNSGCGKTWLMEAAARATGCPFASLSATSMTSEGYVGGKLDDLFRALVARAKGVQAARFGIAFADEWDKKAFRQGRDVTTLAVQQEVLVPLQGAEFLISGKRSMERPVMFDSRGTFFAFAGAFDGLAEIIRKRASGGCMGFSTGAATKRQEHVLDAIRAYGYVREWVNRLTAVMFLPDPKLGSLEAAAAGGVLESFNALLCELGIVLFPYDDATTRMAEYALESRTFFRGIKSVWWSIAESAVASGEKGTVLVGGVEMDAAIARVSSGSADGSNAAPAVPGDEPPLAVLGDGEDAAGEVE